MKISAKSIILVLVQFLSIYWIFHLTPSSRFNSFSTSLVLLGVFISLWGIFVMRKSTLRITPEVAKSARLIKNGPYKFIRHPMYTGLIIACFGALIAEITFIKIVFYTILLTDLVIKLKYEEGILEKHFSEYKEYREKTFKLLPFIY